MSIEFLNLFLYPILTLLILISVLGYGNFFNNVFSLNKIELELKNIIFIQGLVFVGFFFIFINFFIPISNFISLLTILLGALLYFFFIYKKKIKRNEVIFILSVLVFSIIYSCYAGFNDDFSYHYETIKNYKNKDLFEILHHRRVSYNSHWLFLTSIFSVSFFTSTLFILSSLFFSISIYDFFNLSRRAIRNKEYYLSITSFLILIFFLGVLNQLKDLGTDIPGVIISIYIIIIIFNHLLDKKTESINDIFLIILLLSLFAFIIKISNVLIFLFLFFLLFKIKYNKINYWWFFLICLIPVPWFFQNYVISSCLIWPITITCISNTDLAINEIYLIESFAKGDQNTSIDLNNLSWIKLWLTNHSSKMLETYFIYFIILIIPFIYVFFKKRNNKIYIIKYLKDKYLGINYKFFILIILFCNLIWFFFAPAYRFGVFYNLFFIIILLLPLWLFMVENNYQFILKYSKTVLIVIFIYFIFENITRLDWYMKRYDVWPPISKGELLERKNI